MKHEKDQLNEISNLIRSLEQGEDPYPGCIEIHPTDICNHRCDYCFHGGEGFDSSRVKEILGEDQYSLLFNEMNELKIRFLSIAGGGEPFTDKRTPYLLRRAHEAGLETRIVTNGNFLSQEAKEELMNSREIRFSIDAITPATYTEIRHVSGKLLSRTLENVRDLNRMKKEKGSTLNIGTTFLISAKNYGELVEFCKSMLDSGFDSVIVKHDIYGIQNIPSEELHSIGKQILKMDDSRIELREVVDPKVRGIKCYTPHFKVSLNPYGEVFSCCLGSQPMEKNGYLLGNIHDHNLQDVWRSSKQIRIKMKSRGVVCNACNYTDYKINKKMRHINGN
ncbi:radical SAM protein [Candidatus Woesearchaeota archaeon]|nr:radical SAM protein [Candidatus Woesearchaeota archaeon]